LVVGLAKTFSVATQNLFLSLASGWRLQARQLALHLIWWLCADEDTKVNIWYCRKDACTGEKRECVYMCSAMGYPRCLVLPSCQAESVVWENWEWHGKCEKF
jgi:hypothetical protein